MALSAYAIPTLAEVKAFLKVSSTDTTLDSTLETWIDKASLQVESIVGNKVAVQSITSEIHDGDGSDILRPHYYPIVQLSTESSPSSAQKLAALQYRDTPDSSWTDLATDIDHVFLDTDHWDYVQLYDGTFPVGYRNISISYKAGYSVIPGDIWQVAVEMVAWWYRQSAEGDFNVGKQSSSASESGVNVSTTWRDMMREWERRLKPYKKDMRRRTTVEVWR